MKQAAQFQSYRRIQFEDYPGRVGRPQAVEYAKSGQDGEDGRVVARDEGELGPRHGEQVVDVPKEEADAQLGCGSG